MQPSNSMQQRMQQAQGINNAALDTSIMGMGGTTINNITNINDDHSQQTGGNTLIAGSTDDRHTSNVQDTTMNPHWGVG